MLLHITVMPGSELSNSLLREKHASLPSNNSLLETTKKQKKIISFFLITGQIKFNDITAHNYLKYTLISQPFIDPLFP